MSTSRLKGRKTEIKHFGVAVGFGFSPHRSARITFSAGDMDALYMMLIRICCLTPAVERLLPLGLPLFNLRGRLGRAWARNAASHRRRDAI